MKLKYTKGKWIQDYNLIVDEHNNIICDLQRFDASDESNANARLIYTAPEMLEYLIDFVKPSFESYSEKELKIWINANINLVKIIEKATGLKIEEVLSEKDS